jgi:hypothetical protein
MKKLYFVAMVLCLGTVLSANTSTADMGDVRIGGFVSQGYLKTDHNNYLVDSKTGSYEFNEMGVNFQTNPSENLRIGAQLFARDLGDVGNDKVYFNWVFGEYNWKEWMGFRAGIIKTAFGLYNGTRDYDMLRTPIFLPSSVYNEWTRDAFESMKGFQAFGNVELGKAGLLKYELTGGNIAIPTDSGAALFLKKVTPSVDTISDIQVDPVYSGYLEWKTPLDGLRLAYTNFYAKKLVYDMTITGGLASTATVKDAIHQVFSVEYLYNNLLLAGEYYKSDYDSHTVIPAINFSGSTKYESGDRYYLSASYRFTNWLETGAYYSMYENDKHVNADANELKDICGSVRFDITPNTLVKFEIHKMNGLFGVFTEDDGSTNKNWMLYGAKVSYNF